MFCDSFASLQSAIMMLLDGQEDSSMSDAILVQAISGAQRLGLHRLGEAKVVPQVNHEAARDGGSSDASFNSSHIRLEVGVRIW